LLAPVSGRSQQASEELVDVSPNPRAFRVELLG
jgi:hypothetical protein